MTATALYLAYISWTMEAVRTLVTMPALPPAQSVPFSDVPKAHWAAKAVNELKELGILSGYPKGG